MSFEGSTRLLFSGKKCFRKANSSIDVLLIQHSPAQVIEVIAYEPDLQRETPHLYVDEAVLLLALDSCSIVVNGSQSCAHVLDRAKVDYIFDRIVVSSDPSESEHFEIEIVTNSDSDMKGLLIAKPNELVAYTSPFMKLRRGHNDYTPLTMRIPVSADCSTGCDQESPRGENRGIAERVMWKHLANSTSPKSIADLLDAAYGAPPSALYNTKVSTTSPNLSNPAGSVGNPRMVPRRSALKVPALEPPLPLRLESVSTPCTPRERSPSCGGADFDPENLPVSRGRPMMRAFGNTLSLIGKTVLRRGHSNLTECSEYDGDHVGLPFDANTTTANKSISLGNKISHAAREHKHTTQKQVHQRRHTYHLDQCPATQQLAGHNLDTSASTANVSYSLPRTRLLRMRHALDSLHLSSCWPGAGAGCSKISPSVSTHALDQLELEASPY